MSVEFGSLPGDVWRSGWLDIVRVSVCRDNRWMKLKVNGKRKKRKSKSFMLVGAEEVIMTIIIQGTD